MNRETWNSLIRSLLLVRLGQELGTVGPLAKAVHDVLDLISAVVFFG